MQYTLLLHENSLIDWKISKSQKKIEGFSILVNGKWEYFEMEKTHLEFFKQFLDAKISYQNIHSLYKMISFCGRGSYGHVFKYQNRISGEQVACKSLKIGSKNTQQIFLQEVRKLQILKHPSIVKLKEFYLETKHCYIVMEFLEGKSLRELQGQKRLNEEEIILILKQILHCIHYIHKEGYVYRDIKQDNVLFAEQGNLNSLRLIDFGLAITLNDLTAQGNRICGTPGYLAPEVINQAKDLDYKIDMFSLGVMLWEMIHNKRFFEGCDQSIQERMNRQYKFSDEFTKNIENQTLRHLVEKMIHHNPDQRLTAMEALNYLDWSLMNKCENVKEIDNNISTD
ncbi:unnamed protein product (macronuclear) [Paramecium tetraurelia]|uniref:Protein kinase domain-containing protein n=1 Tax=Paramecium tetraurelia TaxID=5888 RepID=A0C6R7_PARTE|nr:uncharacterized protein GSPATT00035613001 [Paramecium tetraurelia]CAK66484.1 unnamed protein product [Paramecium tetraurelia]|eukprot:XP_001433881.1 hypothetical protein (macronuclear) [Paramecium tetraurelia strain d4-2]